MIDSHQHFWTTSRDDYGWLSADDAVLYRDFGPQHLAPLIERVGGGQTVLVQAAPTVEETRYLLGLADATEWVAAVVGWVALDGPDVEDVLDELVTHRAFRGVRPMIQDIPNDDWMLGKGVAAGLRAVQARGLAFDALVHPRHLSRLLTLLERHPDLRVVIDHAAKPEIRSARFDDWADGIARIARETSACCKLSGLVTEAAPNWQSEDLRPYVAHLLECFGHERLLWGSDWPVVELAGGFDRWWATTEVLLEDLGDSQRAAILGDNAARVYRVEPNVGHAAHGRSGSEGEEE